MDPDQAQHFVGSDLGPNCLQMLPADDTSSQRVKEFCLSIDRCSKNEVKVVKHLDAMLSSSDCVGLYVKILELLRFDIETPEYRGLSIKVKY